MIIRLICSAVLFMSLFFGVAAEECADIFTGGMQNNHLDGEITFNWAGKITNNPSNELDSQNSIIYGSALNSCDTAQCISSGNIAGTFTITDFGSGVEGDISLAASDGAQTRSPGEYTSLSLGFNANLTLEAGDYYFTGDFTNNSQNNIIISGDSTSVVRIFVQGSVAFGFAAGLNETGDSSQVLLYSNGNVSIGNAVNASGLIYSNEDVTLDYSSVVNGAINAKNISAIGTEITVNYPDAIPDICDVTESAPSPDLGYCDTTFVNGATSWNDNQTGSISFEGDPTIYNDKNGVLQTQEINGNNDDSLTCKDNADGSADRQCTASGSGTEQLDIGDFIENSGGGNINNITGSITLGEGAYNTDNFRNVRVRDGGNVTFSSNYSVYYIRTLDLLNNNSDSATVNFAPGEYHIGTFNAEGNTVINITSPGEVRIIVANNSSFTDNVQANIGGDPEDFLIYSEDDFSIENTSEVHGLIYTENNADMLDTARLVGAISARSVRLRDNSEIYYTCDAYIAPPVTPILDYRFDECEYIGAPTESDEIIDQTGLYNADAYNIPNSSANAVINQSLNLSAIDTTPFEWLQVPNEAIDGLSDFTLSVWVKTSISKTQQEIFHALGDSTGDDELELAIQNSNNVYLKVRDNSTTLTSSISLTDDVWHHILVTRQGQDACLYVDGIEEDCNDGDVNSGDLDVDDDNAIVIGQEQDSFGGNFDSRQSFDGHLDEFKIYDTLLDDSEINDIYQNELSGKNYDGSDRDIVSCSVPAYIEYRFDEDFWSGIAGEVKDEIENFDAEAINNTNTANIEQAIPTVNGLGTCGYGTFSQGNTQDSVQYVALPSDFENLTESFTITAWIKPSNTDAGSRIFADDENNNGGFAFSLGDPGSGKLRFYSRRLSPVSVDTVSSVIDTDKWTFVSVVHNLENKTREIYVNGIAQDIIGDDGITGKAHTYSGSWGTDSGIATIGGESRDAGEWRNQFEGDIDEVRLYKSALSASNIDEIFKETHACDTPIIDHFEIDTKNAIGLTCEPDLITISACSDASCSVPYADAVDVILSISDAGGVVLNKGVTVVGGTTDVNYIHTTAGVVSLSLDQTYECDNGSSSSCDVSFSDAGFRFVADKTGVDLPVQLSGKPSNTGYNTDTLKVEAVKTDSTGACAPLLITGQSIEMAASYQSPTAGTKKVNISGVDIGTANNGTAFDSLPFEPVPLDFGDDTQSSAEFIFTYADAGSVLLNGRYELPDDDGNPSGEFITGTSEPIIVRPFAFDIFVDTELDSGSYKTNPGAVNASGDVFTVAGEDIRITTRAVAWKVGDDTNANGIADQGEDLTDSDENNTTENFTLISLTSLLHTKVAPTAGVDDGVLSVDVGGAFSSGVQIDNASYNEVGIFSLDANYTNYLSSGENITGSIPYVGRFTPDHFTVTSLNDGEIWSTCDAVSSATSLPFAYTGQMLLTADALGYSTTEGALGYSTTPNVTIEARSKNDKLTQNYIGDFMKLTTDSFTRRSTFAGGIEIFAPYEDAAQVGKDLTNNVRIDTLLSEGSFTNVNGEITYSYSDDDNFVYVHEENSEIIEFTADIDLPMVSIIDGDTIETVDFDGITPDNGFIFTLNPTAPDIRFGRAQLDNSYGPDTADLPQKLSVNYFTENGYKLSDTDTCTTFDSDNITLTDITLDPVVTPIKEEVTGTFSDELPFGETHDIILKAPTTGTVSNIGQVCVSYAVFPWLQYQWAIDEDNLQCAYETSDVDGFFNDNPHAVATFGLYRGNDRVIYQREISR